MSRASPGIIDYKIAHPVRQFIASGAANETVPDTSIFRRQLEAALRDREADHNRDGYVSGSELGDFLQSTVVNYSYNAQHPQYGKIRDPGLDKGDFVFDVGKPPPPVVVAPVAPPQPAPQQPPDQPAAAPQQIPAAWPVVAPGKDPAPTPAPITGGDVKGGGVKKPAAVDGFKLDGVKRWGVGASYSAPVGFDAKITFFESYKERGTFFWLPNSYFVSAGYFSGNEFGTSEWEAKTWSFGLGALYQIRLGAGQRFLLRFGPSVHYDTGTAAYTGADAEQYAETGFDVRGIGAEALGGVAFRFTPALSVGVDAVFHAGSTFHFVANAGLSFHRPY
jgi:hypothetical protein